MVTRPKRGARLHIDEWMGHLQLADEALAIKIGTNRVTMWRWRNQPNRLNPQKIARIAAGMGIEPEDLWRDPKRPSLDALVKDADAETLDRAAQVVKIMLKTGT